MSTNAVLAETTSTLDLVDACALVGQMAETGIFPNKSIEEVRESIGLVAKRLGNHSAWTTKISFARVALAIEIDRVARENADRRKAEAVLRAEESQKRLREAAEKAEADRKFRHDRNLRHAQNKAARAEANRTTAKGFGAGTSQPQGKQKGGKKR